MQKILFLGKVYIYCFCSKESKFLKRLPNNIIPIVLGNNKSQFFENFQEIWGEQFWRPYAHVDDLCRASILVLESKKENVNSEVFGVGDTKENYQKGMIIREINKLVHGEIKYVAKDEDPRDYRVDFSKIKNELGFSISKTVPDGIAEIKKIVESGIITDCYSSKFKNI